MEKHKKVTARNMSVSKMNQRDSKNNIFFEDRILLGHRVNLVFPDNNVDEFFYGRRIVKYPDGEVHLHVELVCDSGDNYEMKPVAEQIFESGCVFVQDNVDIEGDRQIVPMSVHVPNRMRKMCLINQCQICQLNRSMIQQEMLMFVEQSMELK